MGLDITIMERKDYCCPDCGKLVHSQIVSDIPSGGKVWYRYLESIGYYVPYEKRTAENDWYGKDRILSDEEAEALADFASENLVYNADLIVSFIAIALLHKNKIVIKADW